MWRIAALIAMALLQGGISSGLTQLQAEQADKARACLAPYMPGIVQAIVQSK
jgi:hypothetical protein